MFPKRPARSPSALLSCALAASLVGGCGGGASTARPTLPREELPLLALLPNDAFVAGRLDVAELRATPHWAALMEQLRNDEPELVQYAEGTRHVYFGIGGLVQMPPSPPSVDGDGNYLGRPAWVEWSERFGGYVPAAVVVIEGAGASLCAAATEQHEHRTEGGYEVTDVDGVAILTRGDDFCAATFTPMVATLLGEPEGASDIVQRLGGETPATVMRLALQVNSPTVTELLERFGEPMPADAEAPVPEGLSEEDAAQFRADAVAMRESQQRRAEFVRAAIRIVAQGLTDVSWQVASDAEGFETRTHVVGLDESRLGMWREATQMFFDIVTAAVRTGHDPSDDGMAAEFVRSVHIDRVGDGYVIVRHTRHEFLTRLLEASVPDELEAPVAAVADPEAFAAQNAMQLIYENLGNGPEAVIATAEPNLAILRAMQDPAGPREIITALADAYGLRGRFADGVALYEQSIAQARAVAEAAEEGWPRDSAVGVMCEYSASLCELQLTQGNAELALAAARAVRPGSQATCADESFVALRCATAASAALGRVDEALTQLASGAANVDSFPYVTARARVLLLGGRAADARELAELLCVGGPANERCYAGTVALLVETVAASATTLAAAEPTLTALASRIGPQVTHRHADIIRLEAADCAMRARLDAASEATRAACALALEHAVAFHGENHERVASIRVHYARALDRARQRDEATAQRAAAQPVIDGLGPQHPLRARPPR